MWQCPLYLYYSTSPGNVKVSLAFGIVQTTGIIFCVPPPCELGAFSIEGDRAKITLVEDGLYGSTADLKGVLFFIWVPKDVTQGEITSMSWTEISHWDLG